MHIHDLIDAVDLARGVDEKLIAVREADDGQRIYNYTDAALYTPGAWDNPAVRQCRGLIVDPSDRIVARPWAKFFNHGQAEAGALDLDAPVEVTDKIDGSLGIIHLDQSGRPRVATRGSFESEQAIHATALLRARVSTIPYLNHYTPLVEIIYPQNRIVCDYGDTDDLVLLGGVNIASGQYLGPLAMASLINWAGDFTWVFGYSTLRDALAAPPRPGAEGLCVRYLNESRIVKIKQEDYVRLHKIVTGLSERSVWEHMGTRAPLNDLIGTLPDELHDWTRNVWSDLRDAVTSRSLAAEAAHADILASLPDGWTRGDYAEQAKKRAPLTPLLFQLLDGRDLFPAIHRSIKPAGDTRAKIITEAVA